MTPQEVVNVWLRTRSDESARLYRYEIDRFLKVAQTSDIVLAVHNFDAALQRDVEIKGVGQRGRFRALWRSMTRVLADAGMVDDAIAQIAGSKLFFRTDIDAKTKLGILAAIEAENRHAALLRTILVTGAPAIEIANLSVDRIEAYPGHQSWSVIRSVEDKKRKWAIPRQFMQRDFGYFPLSSRRIPVRSYCTIRKWISEAADHFKLASSLELDIRNLHIQMAVQEGVSRENALQQAEGLLLQNDLNSLTAMRVSAALARRFFQNIQKPLTASNPLIAA